MLPSLFIPLAFWLVSAIAGAMLFFGAVIAPAIFRTLPEDMARTLMRVVLPRYYLTLGVAGLVASAMAAAGGQQEAALVLLIVSAGFAYARLSILPRVNLLKDKAIAGDETAQVDFDRTHRTSTMLNMAQLAAFLAVAYGLVRGV